MHRDRLADLRIFLTVVEERSFTQAAARLGTTQSAVSNAIQRLEGALGLRLLNRTTRKVAPTHAGERLAAGLKPNFEQIDQEIAGLLTFRDTPSGLIRIAASDHASRTVLWPRLSGIQKDYPELKLEIVVESRFTDIVGEGFDAGVRLGESIDQDMIALRIGPDLRMAVVGSPEYLEKNERPSHPRDLLEHSCINLRLETRGNLYVWEFEKDGRPVNVRVKGSLTFNTGELCHAAALDGHGLAYVQEDRVAQDIAQGRLEWVIPQWSPPFSGYHLYYPSRRQTSAGLALVIDRLRWRGGE